MSDPSKPQPAKSDCARCGWRDRPGHSCTRYWGGDRVGVSRTGYARDGGLSHVYWTLSWKWRGDYHKFLPHFSLGEHINVSARARAADDYEKEEERWADAA